MTRIRSGGHAGSQPGRLATSCKRHPPRGEWRRMELGHDSLCLARPTCDSTLFGNDSSMCISMPAIPRSRVQIVQDPHGSDGSLCIALRRAMRWLHTEVSDDSFSLVAPVKPMTCRSLRTCGTGALGHGELYTPARDTSLEGSAVLAGASGGKGGGEDTCLTRGVVAVG